MQGSVTCHTMAGSGAFFKAQFQSRVISCTAKVKGLPYSPNLPYIWSYAMIHSRQKKLSTINEQKNLQGRRTHDSRADDPRHSGQYPQKCNAHKQAEGDHFESFLQYLKKLFWILFQVLASFFFYESYFLSYTLILGVSLDQLCWFGGEVVLAHIWGPCLVEVLQECGPNYQGNR